MRRSLFLLFLLLCVSTVTVDCRHAFAKPRSRSQPQLTELTRADIPKHLQPDLRALIEATFSDDSEVQDRAIRQLGKMGAAASPAVPFLIRVWASDAILADFQSQITLNEIGGAAAEQMIAKTKHASAKLRPTLIQGLGWCSTWRIREGVLPYFNHPDPACRRAAVESLHGCDDPRVVAPLIRSLADPDAAVRKKAISHFASRPTPTAFEPLVTALSDVDPEVRWEAVGAISYSKDPRIVPVLIGVVRKSGEVENVRRRATFHLGLSADRASVERLLEVLTNLQSGANVRSEAALALGRLKDLRAVEPLLGVLKNRSEPTPTRAAAAHALTDLGDPRALEQLFESAKTEADPELKFWGAMGAATISKGAICDERIVTALRDYAYRRDGFEVHADAKQLALRAIMENGKTESIRWAALTADRLWPRMYTDSMFR